MKPLHAFALAFAGGVLLAPALMAWAEEVPDAGWRAYRSERTPEEDRRAYAFEQHLRDVMSGKELSLDGSNFGWRLCYMQADNGWVTKQQCDDSVGNAERLKLWKAIEARKYRQPAIDVYIINDDEK